MTDRPVICGPVARVATSERGALVERRRAQVVEAAVRLFAAHGFDATTVEAVAREAGVSKGSIYLYFANKEALLNELIERHALLPEIRRLADRLREVPPEQAIPILVERVWEGLKERKDLIRLLMREVPRHPRYARTFMERVILEGNRVVAEYLDAYVERGVLRPLDTHVAGRCLFGALWAFVLSQEVFGGAALHPISDETIVETVSTLFLEGALRREPGANGRGESVP